jgi:tetratricopeptide (TPR) repeat protein
MGKIFLYLILAIAICVIAVLAVMYYVEQRENAAIFAKIMEIDHSGTEVQVVDKITRKIAEARENPDSAESWGVLAMTLNIHDYTEAAIPCFEKAHALDEKDFRWVYLAAVAMDDINSERVIECYEKSKRLNSEYPPLCIKLGNRYLLSGAVDKAAKCFNAVIDADIQVPHAYLGLAKIAMEKNDLAEAEQQINKAVKLAPQYREARALLADIYRRLGEKEKAQIEFNRMASLPERLDLKDPVYYQMVAEGVSSFWCQVRGNNYLNQGDLNNAEEEFKKALEAKPNEASHTSLGYVYQRQKRYEAAMDHYNQALELNSEHVSAMNNLAVAYYELGDINQAMSEIKKALEIDPESADAWLNLGTFSKQSGKWGDALKYFNRGREIEPADMRFVYQLSLLYATAPESQIRNGKEAIRLAEMICEDTKYNKPASLDLLAMALAETGQYEKAKDAAEHAYRLAIRNKENQFATQIKSRQNLYQMQKPFREK